MSPKGTVEEVEVAAGGPTQEKEDSHSNRSPEGSRDKSENGNGVPTGNGAGTGNGNEKDKSEDKDNKAWQEGDFAYEYVQLAQVRLMPSLSNPILYIRGSIAQTSPSL